MPGLTVRAPCPPIRPYVSAGFDHGLKRTPLLSPGYFLPLLVWSHIVPYMTAPFLCLLSPATHTAELYSYQVTSRLDAGTRHWNNAVVSLLLLRA